MANVNIACKLNGGLVLNGFFDLSGNPIRLNGPSWPANGLNPGPGGLGAGITAIDSAVWAAWSTVNASIVASGAVFQAS
jgi:hypothetical protein